MQVIVIGAGHNGLTAATSLAKAGHQVTVLEARDQVGGVGGTNEFHPGYHHSGLLHDSAAVRPSVIAELKLADHGLKLQAVPPVQGRGADGQVLRVHSEVDKSEVGSDAEGYAALRTIIARIKPFAATVLDGPAPQIGAAAKIMELARPAIGMRRLGKKQMMQLLRIAPTCVDDFVTEHLHDPALRAMVAMPALTLAWTGPRSPLSTANLLLWEALQGQEVIGGPAALVRALHKAATAAGVTVQTGALVCAIRVTAGAVQGVTLADGTTLDATVVLAAIGPKRALLDLVDPMHLPGITERALDNVRLRGLVAKVHLALSGPLTFADGEPVSYARLVADPLDLERAFDDAKYGRLPSNPPPLEVRVLSGDGVAPQGHSVASIIVYGVPHGLKEGWSDSARDAVLKSVLASLERWCPGASDHIVGHEVLTPGDLERDYHLQGGHLAHGEHALDQLYAMRPTPGLAQHHTPISGLWLGSSGCHPGGGISCGPGIGAAKALLGR
ncbi:MAG: phytoene dehydrogenase-like protein [Kiritimatiellia bacterium]|jgi:phytoene dehydrogenase-like protein